MLLSDGEVCDKLWYLQSGLVRGYHLVADGEGNFRDVTDWFASEHDFFHAADSFVKQLPSRECIETLEPSVLIYITRADLYQLYADRPEACCIGRITYPPGWTLSGSGNIVTLTPNAGSGGVIKVTTSRNDVPGLTTSSQLIITRPVPTKPVINSPDFLLCNPQTITATASNATSYNWVTTGGITANSPGNTNSAQITGVSDGTVKVSATSSVCGVTSAFSNPINVKRSAPAPAALSVTGNGGGTPDFMCNGAGVMLSAYTSEPGTTFGA
ncbi:hypothetical protein [Dyadobacter sp. 676]|uniref:PKD-like domain-containing protein n=1 Tax=Dyadobacter sp. 676 TaxID=3088362 RepID=A0AAU8FFG2_9BACT